MDQLSIIQPPEFLEFNDIPEYETQDYDVFDEKDFRKYINDVKKSVRGSLEYRQFIQYLRLYFHLNTDSYFENVNNIDTSKIRIEIHHTPYTLEDICITVFNKRVFYGEEIDIEDVAKEVMYIHYHLMVGLYPLAETTHELVHNNFIFIPTNKVFGNYKEFENVYGPWISEETKDKLKSIEQRTIIYNEEIDKALLTQTHIPIQMTQDVSGFLPSMQSIEVLMNKRLEEIRYQNSHAIVDNSHDNNIIDSEIVQKKDNSLIRGVTYDD